MNENDQRNTLLEALAQVNKSGEFRRALATFLLSCFALLLIVIAGNVSLQHQLSKYRSSESFDDQIQRLNQTETALKELQDFVRQQRQRLRESEEVVESMKSEREKLKPMVEADRRTVEAILAARDTRESFNVWWERGIGFVGGLAASLIANLIWAVASAWWRKRRT